MNFDDKNVRNMNQILFILQLILVQLVLSTLKSLLH